MAPYEHPGYSLHWKIKQHLSDDLFTPSVMMDCLDISSPSSSRFGAGLCPKSLPGMESLQAGGQWFHGQGKCKYGDVLVQVPGKPQ
ncbi:hypothetical protein STEG23_018730 [Scotinomys teguina]